MNIFEKTYRMIMESVNDMQDRQNIDEIYKPLLSFGGMWQLPGQRPLWEYSRKDGFKARDELYYFFKEYPEFRNTIDAAINDTMKELKDFFADPDRINPLYEQYKDVDEYHVSP